MLNFQITSYISRKVKQWETQEKNDHGYHQDWKSGKTWKNRKAFSSQGKVREFFQDWKSQGILLKILEKSEKNYTGKLKRILEKSGKFVSQ